MSGGPVSVGVAAPPPVAVEEAAAIAASLWGLTGEVKPLPSERDQNFLIASGADRHVLKIANPVEQRAMLAAQNAVMMRIAASTPGLVQEPLPTLDDDLLTSTTIAGGQRFVRMLTYLPGKPLGDLRWQPPGLLHSVGAAMARVDEALDGHDDDAFHRHFYWDLEHAASIIADGLDLVEDEELGTLVGGFLERFQAEVTPRLANLRTGLIHGDPNEYNLLVGDSRLEISGVLDLGDMVWSRIVYDPAIAAAYAITGGDDPLGAVLAVAAGYHAVRPLEAEELALLHALACARLCQSVCVAAVQQRRDPSNQYLSVSQRRIRATLPDALAIPFRLAEYALRNACGMPAIERGAEVGAWMAEHVLPVVEPPAEWGVPDLSPGATDAGRPPGPWSAGRHDEPRLVPPATRGTITGIHPTVHLGTDMGVPAGTAILAPIDGTVIGAAAEADEPTIVLEHATPLGGVYTIYRGLDPDSVVSITPGTTISQGAAVGTAGPAGLVQLQLVLDLLDMGTAFPALVPAPRRTVWSAVSPDPSSLLGLPAGSLTAADVGGKATLRRRRAVISSSLSVSYRDPLKMVRGEGCYLIDETGRRYLDCVNNVAHVGHSNPRVVAALTEQATVLNTNARYLHDAIVEYAEQLGARLPGELSMCFFMNSGSEANDLALRIARTVTGRRDVLTLEGAYHGNSQTDIDVSPYKYRGPGGAGRAAWVHEVPTPDSYRGLHPGFTAESGAAYARELEGVLAALDQQERRPAAFICEPIMSCAGQIEPPPTFLARSFDAVRAAGGVCIADEVQVGFGRVGDAFWAFETQGVTPDIVTLGKPIGNGHPMAAVVTTPAIAAAFANGMEYFSTFGGNPVSAAVGLAVLREIDEAGLQANARAVGGELLSGLRTLAEAHPAIGDFRGRGLFLGIELVRDRDSKLPAANVADYLVNRLRDQGVLLSTDGPAHNVIKIKPPLVFGRREATLLLERLDAVLAELE